MRCIRYLHGTIPGEAALVNALSDPVVDEKGRRSMSVLQECNDAEDIVYVQFIQKGDNGGASFDEKGNPKIIPARNLDYLRLKKELANQDYISFITFDSFRNEIVFKRGDPKIEKIMLVREIEGNNVRKYIFVGDNEPKADYPVVR
jgi:hypothetical protein